jgi:muramoyltetrapeptide carboxypeptidase
VIRPGRLKAGDRIALVAPASAFDPQMLDAGVAEVRRLGFEPVYDEAILARGRFEAGPADLRARLLHNAWRDPSISGLLAVRGGYGSQQLLPLLDPVVMREAAKPLVGYSDITALLSWSWANGVIAFHGPMIEGRLASGTTAYDPTTFVGALTRVAPLGPLRPPGLEVFVPGDAWGLLVGGTLTQLVSMLGTPWAARVPHGGILFLEDVAERPYRVHRMLTQLAQAGVLALAGALVFGEFPGCDEPGGTPAIRDVLREFVQGFPGPVLFGFPSGHTVGQSWTLPFGVRARVAGGTDPALVIEEAAVK